MWVCEEDLSSESGGAMKLACVRFVDVAEEKGGWGADLASSEDMFQAGIQMKCSRSDSLG